MTETIIILNRWDDDFSRYDEYINHSVHRVAYIATEAGSKVLNKELAQAIEVVKDITNKTEVLAAARRLAERLGQVTRVLALSEFDLEMGATVREALGVKGPWPHIVRLYKDKVAMKEAVEAAGIRVPRYAPLGATSSPEELTERFGLPLILKPRVGASSRGVFKVETTAQLAAIMKSIRPDEYECEQYIDGPIFHTDGLVQDGELLFRTLSQYINTCLAFNQGVSLGSVMVDEPSLRDSLLAFTRSVLDALSLKSGAFHLEIIQDRRGEFYFLEIGARVGGGEIPFLAKELFNLDLMKAWVDIELGQDANYLRSLDKGQLGGFLMVPEPRNVPCRLVRINSLTGRVENLIGETLPPVGHVFDGKGGYEHISGRFLFAGPSSRAIAASIHATLERFHVETEPVEPTMPLGATVATATATAIPIST